MRDAFIWLHVTLLIELVGLSRGAIVPPPWSDPNKNPCAQLPGGWQLLYWPPLKKCFKIFQMGYPCPETMELSPVGASRINLGYTAECRCPPGTAQSPVTSKCHTIFERGPCDFGEYFAPLQEMGGQSPIPKQRWGTCKKPEKCSNGSVFWPQDNKCYALHTQGPCAKGKLITLDNNNIAKCQCNQEGDLMKFYHSASGSCHEHFTRGPCQGTGELFLPSRKCTCHNRLPHFHNATNQCYEIGTIGPCPMGHTFIIPETVSSSADASNDIQHAQCQCKEGYVLHKDGYCYRLYTRGPCDDGYFVAESATCFKNPCDKGRLYFPKEKTCYRIGSQGPCSVSQVVVFDFTARPSLDGISYNGVCGCAGIISNLDQTCTEDEVAESACDSTPGMVEINKQCYQLYTRGPCGPGQWLEPKKIQQKPKSAKCQCRPGNTPYDDKETELGVSGCHAPSVSLARYLNSKTYKNYRFAFRRMISLLGSDF